MGEGRARKVRAKKRLGEVGGKKGEGER